MVGMYPCTRKNCEIKGDNGRCTIYGNLVGVPDAPFCDPKDCTKYKEKGTIFSDENDLEVLANE